MNTAELIERLTKGAQSFAAEMREKGIHVGMGRPPMCVTCDQEWPCPGAR